MAAEPMISYDEWVPLVMGQDVAPQNVKAKKEVERLKLGLELEEVFGSGGDDGGEGAADVDVDEEVGGHEGEGAGAHPSGGAAVLPPTPGLSQEVQQTLDHSHNIVLGKTPLHSLQATSSCVCHSGGPNYPLGPNSPPAATDREGGPQSSQGGGGSAEAHRALASYSPTSFP